MKRGGGRAGAGSRSGRGGWTDRTDQEGSDQDVPGRCTSLVSFWLFRSREALKALTRILNPIPYRVHPYTSTCRCVGDRAASIEQRTRFERGLDVSNPRRILRESFEIEFPKLPNDPTRYATEIHIDNNHDDVYPCRAHYAHQRRARDAAVVGFAFPTLVSSSTSSARTRVPCSPPAPGVAGSVAGRRQGGHARVVHARVRELAVVAVSDRRDADVCRWDAGAGADSVAPVLRSVGAYI